ncbi:vWA domain-containing protein [Vibrio agarivorans]|uniref:VWA domain-containing protein n=1 Tax=Vibrio agarivorans TaxID=153622 RepID=A0ABT7XZH0_9VIBR|nr:VWA domain-containing protein [Vibrio agarivorans]MDN2481180.1 VWA domain-containing protein [Vibrio agarivorans]
MGNFHFLRPEWLLLLVPFLVLVVVKLREGKKLSSDVNALPPHLRKALLVGDGLWRTHSPILLLVVMGILASIVVAGPSWKRQLSPISEDNSALVVVLDVSDSMLQSDIAPSRLYRAKQKITALIDKRNAGLTSLVVYSGSAHLAMPLTKDKAVFKPLLDGIAPSVMPRQGKFEHYSIPVLHSLLRYHPSNATVLLVSDGMNSSKLDAWKAYFAESGHQLLIWGMGVPGSATSLPLDERSLERLARAVGGEYIRFDSNDSDIQHVLRNLKASSVHNGEDSEPWLDSGYAFIWLMIPIYLLWARKGWIVQWCVPLLVFASVFHTNSAVASDSTFVDLWLSKDQQGQYFYQQQNFLQAAKTFDDYYWKAESYYRAGEYGLAKNYYLRMDSLQAQLGVGASLARQKAYVEARDWYQTMQADYPDNETVRANLALILETIDYINQFTEGQAKSNERQKSKELGDKPKQTEGVEQLVQQDQILEEKLSAADILNSDAMNDKWMKRVESNLTPFLSNKFYLQLEQGLGTQQYEVNGLNRNVEEGQ